MHKARGENTGNN